MKEIKKLVPQIKQQLSQVAEVAQKTIEQIDMKKVSNGIQKGIQSIKKCVENLKKSNKTNELEIIVNNKEASKQISQVQKQIDSLQEKINSRQLKLDVTNETLDKIRNETNQNVIKDMPDAGNKKTKQETYKRLDNNNSYTSLVTESDKLNAEIEKYNALLETAKQKLTQLEQESNQNVIVQNKGNNILGSFKEKLEQAKTPSNGIKNAFSQIPKITQSMSSGIKNMAGKMKQGLGHVLKYATTLFSLKSIYTTLSGAAQSWLGSQNTQAQQLSANIEYMKYSMRKCFCTSHRIYSKFDISINESNTKCSICI